MIDSPDSFEASRNNVRLRSRNPNDGIGEPEHGMAQNWRNGYKTEGAAGRRRSSSQGIFGSGSVFTIVGFYLGIFILCLIYDARLPEPKTLADSGSSSGAGSPPVVFVEERARMILKEMTNYGPRPTGSYENEVLTVEFLKYRIQMINQTVDRRYHDLKLDVQTVSGSFALSFINHFASQYANIQNVVVKLEPRRGGTNHAVLLNCHFDSVPFSPGASDDGVSCAIMLEVLAVVARSPVRLKHALVFLFNGAEENMLQGSHGFVTKHPWARLVRVFLNLEACGSGGREIVFQAGPERSWLAEAYRDAAVHPFASVIGQDVFQGGLIPSDTDFRIFRDFGHLSGLDVAFVVNGYVYHTAYDTEDRLPPGSLQRAGDNALAVTLALANDSRMGEEDGKDVEPVVFFDVLGVVMVTYRRAVSLALSASALAAVVCCAWKRFRERRFVSAGKLRRDVALATGLVVLSWVAALGACVAVATLVDLFDKSMSFYGNPAWIFPLYTVPPLVVLSLVQRLVVFGGPGPGSREGGLDRDRRTQEYTFDLFVDATRLLLACLFFALAWSSRGSAFVPMLGMLLPACAELICRSLGLQKFGPTWLALYLLSQFLPLVVFLMYVLYGEYVFIPVMGRAGRMVNPDVLVGCFTGFSVVVYSCYLLPLLHLVPRSGRKVMELSGASITGVAVFLLVVTNLGFPYVFSLQNPRLMRFLLTHTHRRFHDVDGRVLREDSGYWFTNLDRHSPFAVVDSVPELRDAALLGPAECDDKLWCHGPHYYPAVKLLSSSAWLAGPKPVVKDPVAIVSKFVTEAEAGGGLYNVSLKIRGPDHMTMALSPLDGFELVAWSFSDQVVASGTQVGNRPTYFMYFSFGIHPQSWDSWFLLKAVDGARKSRGIVELGVSGHALHGHQARDANLTRFLAKFPAWSYPVGWTASYDHFVV